MMLHFPSITREEFTLACQDLERKCDEIELGDTEWVNVRWHEDVLHIVLSRTVSHIIDQPASAGQIASHDDEEEMENEEIEDEEVDDAAVRRCDETNDNRLNVDFSITLSPTYKVPILWISLGNVPQDGMRSIDAIYHFLVPQASRAALQNTGVMGIIGVASHPQTDLPAFFVHPCLTHDALRALSPREGLSPIEYLLLWLGVVGSCVGLYVPSKLVL